MYRPELAPSRQWLPTQGGPTHPPQTKKKKKFVGDALINIVKVSHLRSFVHGKTATTLELGLFGLTKIGCDANTFSLIYEFVARLSDCKSL